MTSKGLLPDCWGAVLQFVGPRMRFDLDHHCPDLKRFTRNTPIRINKFIWKTREFDIDGCSYHFGNWDNSAIALFFLQNYQEVRFHRPGRFNDAMNQAIAYLLKDKGVAIVNKFVFEEYSFKMPEWMRLIVCKLEIRVSLQIFLLLGKDAILNDAHLNPLDELAFQIDSFSTIAMFDYPLVHTAKSLSIDFFIRIEDEMIRAVLNLKHPKVHLSVTPAVMSNAKMLFIVQQWIQNPPNIGDVMTFARRLTPGLKQMIKATFQATEGAIEEYHNKELYLRPTICIKVGEASQLMIYQTRERDGGRTIHMKMVKME